MKCIRMFIGLCLYAGATISQASTDNALTPHEVMTRDGMLYYEVEGRGEPLILVPGGPGASRISFQPWFGRLAGNHEVVYYDAIGRGRSDRLADPARYTVERDVDDIESLRQALCVQRISLLGQSYGGIPALAYALKYPDHVSHLVLSSAMISAASFQANIDAANATMKTFYPAQWARVQALRATGVRSADQRSEAEYAEMAEMMYWHDGKSAHLMNPPSVQRERLDMTVYRAMLGEDADYVVGGTLKGYDPLPMMQRLTARTLVIGGRYDRVATPEIVTRTFDSIPLPLAQLAIFEHSGHRPWVEESDAYFSRVSDFLDDRAASAHSQAAMLPAPAAAAERRAPTVARAAGNGRRFTTSPPSSLPQISQAIAGNVAAGY